MTHNQYISLFTNIATAHNLVKSFGTGPIHEYLDTNTDTSKGINLWLEVDNSKISGSVITDRFTLYCMDYVNKDVSNRDEVLSDTKRTLEDVIALLHNQLYVDDFELEKSTDLNVFYDNKFANEVCGWYCVISLKNDFVYDSCQIPLNGIPITAISYTVDVSSGFTLAVTATRTLTINGVTYDLSADRTWTIATGGNETLAQTLALGNTTGGTNLVVSTGDKIVTSSGQLSMEFGVMGNVLYMLDNTNTDFFFGQGQLIFNHDNTTTDTLQIDASGHVLRNSTLVNLDTPLFYLTGLTASTVPYLDASKVVRSSAVTPTQLGYLSGATGTTGTAALVYGTSPTFTTNITTPQITGNGATTTGLTFVTSVTASGAIARGVYQTPTLIAAANGDVLTGLQITPTFTLGAFTSTNSFALGMTCGTAQLRMGNITGSTSIAGLYMTPNTPSTANYALYYTTSQTRINQESTTTGSILFQFGGGSHFAIQSGTASGASAPLTHTPATSTNQTLSTNLPTTTWNGRSVQKATGADPLQYFHWFKTNTLSYVGASTCTYSASMAVEYLTRGASAALTTTCGISILTVALVSTTTAIGVDIQLATGATNSYGIRIGAGTTTAAPILLTSGTNMTTAVAGAFEYDGTNLFFTRTGTTRESIICSNAVNTVSPTAQNRTITVVIAGTTYYLTAKTTND